MLADQQRKSWHAANKDARNLQEAQQTRKWRRPYWAELWWVPMTEEVMPSLAGIRWDPNSPAAVLIVTDDGWPRWRSARKPAMP